MYHSDEGKTAMAVQVTLVSSDILLKLKRLVGTTRTLVFNCRYLLQDLVILKSVTFGCLPRCQKAWQVPALNKFSHITFAASPSLSPIV